MKGPIHNGDSHPTTGLDDVVHQRTRLGLLAVLSETRQADFGYLKSILQLTDGNLGRHLEVLAQQDLVKMTKGYHGKRPRTWVEITRRGRTAFAAEMSALRELLRRFETFTTEDQ
ncbi:transcriptional regulator [Streptomyces sp. TX20-6-3]|uniref:winged helix-turn-helix domain-containing protein n=1 Tax=Streptomyces sp. TX20-6-3 TaxID=3028705 RepID=UPI0029B8F3F9|nr:transcriptional regulator [Streptomyces sp. TX20-6-3]MDX2565384.1 transcriptional regulator [Streptomyces sp. TX20-6-3]